MYAIRSYYERVRGVGVDAQAVLADLEADAREPHRVVARRDVGDVVIALRGAHHPAGDGLASPSNTP